MKLLQREPTLYIAAATAILTILGTLGLGILDPIQAAALVIAINAVAVAVNAWTVRPISPVAFTYAVGAILAVFAAYGLELPAETIAAINAAVIPILALASRGQVSPEETAVTTA